MSGLQQGRRRQGPLRLRQLIQPVLKSADLLLIGEHRITELLLWLNQRLGCDCRIDARLCQQQRRADRGVVELLGCGKSETVRRLEC